MIAHLDIELVLIVFSFLMIVYWTGSFAIKMWHSRRKRSRPITRPSGYQGVADSMAYKEDSDTAVERGNREVL